MSKEMGERIRAARERAGFDTQQQLAQALGVTEAWLAYGDKKQVS